MGESGERKTMNKQKVPAYILLIALVCLGVFLDAPVIPQQVKIPCYVGPTGIMGHPASFYLNETEWMSPGYALFGFGIDIPPADPCPNLP
jgi:hypothetical protein